MKCNHLRIGEAPCKACQETTDCTRCGGEIEIIEGEETPSLCDECQSIEDAADLAEMQFDIDCARGIR